jgi:NADH-quinone oxidoreductase subunit N
MALVICGLLTKLGAVPFHQWLPDTVRGAPPAVVVLGVGVGGTAVAGSLARLVVTTFPAQTSNWTALIAIVAALSMLYGNIAALTQSSLRRLIGLLVVGQSGVLLLGLLGAAPAQLATTGVTVAGMLTVLALLDGVIGDDLDDVRGLSRRSPLGATMLGVGAVSLLGAPPLLGFFAKLFLLQSAVLAGWAWLVVVALVTSVIGAVPAVRLLAVMFVDMPDEDADPVRVTATAARVAVGACAAATVLLGILAQPLFTLASGGAGAVH